MTRRRDIVAFEMLLAMALGVALGMLLLLVIQTALVSGSGAVVPFV
jgi:uncharacterized membrane protein YgaE (UPF0421/DUF939 family)